MRDTQDIVMPLEQEGSKSVVRVWLKRVGETVRRDEPVVELETDKVAVEIPSPADGVLAAIAIAEGEDAPPGAVLGVLSLGADAVAPKSEQKVSYTGSGTPSAPPASRNSNNGARDHRLSPLVKRLVAEHRLDVGAIAGSGRDGRVTHKDVEAAIAGLQRAPTAPAAVSVGGVRSVPHDSMRRAIAEHMTRSVLTAPHVTAVFEADFSAIAAHRARHKAAYEKHGAALTYSAYIVQACCEAMKVAPTVNSRWQDDAIEVFEDVNVGVGVALGDKGLIVPVIKRAQTLSLLDTARALQDATERARAGRLKPADVQGGTFSISNHGVSGSLIAAPIIINQPQAAILGVGKLEKRVVVREVNGADAMLIRPMAYVSLTIDHRVLDGHQTNLWLTRFAEALETWPLEETV